jgi:putative transcriptional regulator
MRLPSMRSALMLARMRTGLSQAELAETIGVSRQTISSIENRHSIPSVLLAPALARFLGAPVEELFPVAELQTAREELVDAGSVGVPRRT